MKSLKFKLEDFYIKEEERYDYDKIIISFCETGAYQNKFDLANDIMEFGRGKLLSTLVEHAINRNL
jgi:hypothetical protein